MPEELLRSAALILKDEEKQIEEITLAALLLFGKDATMHFVENYIQKQKLL